MILQHLHNLYDRLAADARYGIAPSGWSVQKITFVVVLTPNGRLHDIQDARSRETTQTKAGKEKTRMVPFRCVVPGGAKSAGPGFNPCFLWDNTGYALGYDAGKPDRAKKTFAAFRDRHLALEKVIGDPVYSSVCRFLKAWQPDMAGEYKGKLDDFAATGFGIFQMQGETEYVHEKGPVQEWWNIQESEASDAPEGICLVTGDRGPIARLHEPKIKGVAGAQSAGGVIVGFKEAAGKSYDKDQSFNAPVSEEAVTRYCKALNALTSGPQSNKHRLQIGDSTTVFWTEKPTAFENCLVAMLAEGEHMENSEAAQDEDVRGKLEVFLRCVRDGGGHWSELGDDPETLFYVLGLTGQAVGRLGVRFWHSSSIADLAAMLKHHLDDLSIAKEFGPTSKRPDLDCLPVWMLLRQTARDAKDVPPILSGPLLRAIVTGSDYPQAFYNAVRNRIRADREISYPRAAILKAYLNRYWRNHQTPNRKGVTMSLDTERRDPAYRLGRLFAALEMTQQDALGRNLNATIRDRFYSAASATPGVVFPRLLRTYQHHLSKAAAEKGQGYKIAREKLVQEIVGCLDDIPRHLGLEAQGLFALGYYHQTRDFFTKHERKAEKED